MLKLAHYLLDVDDLDRLLRVLQKSEYKNIRNVCTFAAAKI